MQQFLAGFGDRVDLENMQAGAASMQTGPAPGGPGFGGLASFMQQQSQQPQQPQQQQQLPNMGQPGNGALAQQQSSFVQLPGGFGQQVPVQPTQGMQAQDIFSEQSGQFPSSASRGMQGGCGTQDAQWLQNLGVMAAQVWSPDATLQQLNGLGIMSGNQSENMRLPGLPMGTLLGPGDGQGQQGNFNNLGQIGQQMAILAAGGMPPQQSQQSQQSPQQPPQQQPSQQLLGGFCGQGLAGLGQAQRLGIPEGNSGVPVRQQQPSQQQPSQQQPYNEMPDPAQLQGLPGLGANLRQIWMPGQDMPAAGLGKESSDALGSQFPLGARGQQQPQQQLQQLPQQIQQLLQMQQAQQSSQQQQGGFFGMRNELSQPSTQQGQQGQQGQQQQLPDTPHLQLLQMLHQQAQQQQRPQQVPLPQQQLPPSQQQQQQESMLSNAALQGKGAAPSLPSSLGGMGRSAAAGVPGCGGLKGAFKQQQLDDDDDSITDGMGIFGRGGGRPEAMLGRAGGAVGRRGADGPGDGQETNGGKGKGQAMLSQGAEKGMPSMGKGGRASEGDRCELFVGRLSQGVSESGLRDLFRSKGLEVRSLKLPMDAQRQTNKGYAFVGLANPAQVQKAIEQLNGFMLDGKPINVEHSAGQAGAGKGERGKNLNELTLSLLGEMSQRGQSAASGAKGAKGPREDAGGGKGAGSQKGPCGKGGGFSAGMRSDDQGRDAGGGKKGKGAAPFPKGGKGPSSSMLSGEVAGLGKMKYGNSPNKLFVGNLASDVESEDVAQALAPAGDVISVRVLEGKYSSIGFVEFRDPASVETAVRTLQGVDIRGRPARMEFQSGKGTGKGGIGMDLPASAAAPASGAVVPGILQPGPLPPGPMPSNRPPSMPTGMVPGPSSPGTVELNPSDSTRPGAVAPGAGGRNKNRGS